MMSDDGWTKMTQKMIEKNCVRLFDVFFVS